MGHAANCRTSRVEVSVVEHSLTHSLRCRMNCGRRNSVAFGPLMTVIAIGMLMSTASAEFPKFVGNSGEVFTSIFVSQENDDVFIGGKNNIWQADKHLSNVKHVVQSRVNDSLSCGPPPAYVCREPVTQRQERDNYVLLLHADHARNRLIACGNVYYGACELLNLTNIKDSSSMAQYFPQQDGYVIPPVLTNPSLITSSMSPDGKKLFVATPSFSGDGMLNPVVRTLSTSTFELDTQHSEIRIQNSGLDFPSGWVASFNSQGYVYFVYRQEIVGRSAKPSTSLVRICASDSGFGSSMYFYKGYGSYVQMPFGYYDKGSLPTGTFAQAAAIVTAGTRLASMMPISSNGMGVGKPVVVAAFDASNGGGSLIGIVPLETINSVLTRKEKDCAGRIGQAGTEEVGSVRLTKCSGFVTENASTAVCGQPKHAPLAVLQHSLDAASQVLALSAKYRIRSLVSASYGNHTVVFGGTDNGHVIKILVDSFGQDSATVYDDVTADDNNRPIVRLLLSANSTSLYALANVSGSGSTASSELIKVPVYGCERFTTCTSCTSPRSSAGPPIANPLCGWCTYTGKCTSRSSCIPAARPFHQNSSACPAIISVSPSLIPSQTQQKIYINVTNLSLGPNGTKYHCNFGQGRLSVASYENNTGLYFCTSPKMKIAEALVNIPFGFFFPATGDTFLNYSGVQGFNCRAHYRCDECLQTAAPCGWCSYNNLCTISKDLCGAGESKWLWGGSSVIIAKTCPVFVQEHDVQHVDRQHQFTITASNLPALRPATTDTYQCLLTSGDPATKMTMPAAARSNGDGTTTVTCLQRYFTGKEMLSSGLKLGWVEMQLALLWNAADISGPAASLVTFYSCAALAQGDCSLCIAQLRLPKAYPPAVKFQCRWCQDRNQCSEGVRAGCSSNSQECPAPIIRSIYPRSGPTSGGTLVKIEGSNLGSQMADVSEVLVDGAVCNIQNYSAARSLTCVTTPSQVTNQPGRVEVWLYNWQRPSIPSAVKYEYTEPTLSSVFPLASPISGGTLVSLAGTSLDTGRNVKITVAGVECKLAGLSCRRPTSLCQYQPTVARNSSNMWCYTSPDEGTQLPDGAAGSVKITIDGYELQVQGDVPSFQYMKNPKIAENGISTSMGILSGGIEVTVHGENFDGVGELALMIRFEEEENTTICSWHNNATAKCVFPAFPRATPYASAILVCDGEELLILHNFRISDDPVVDEQMATAANDLLRLTGMDLDKVPKEAFRVYIGDTASASLCNVTSVEETDLICRLPPSFRNVPATVTAKVTVAIGENLRYGSVELLKQPQPISNNNDVTRIAGSVAGGAAFLLIIFLLLFLYCQNRARTAESEVGRLENDIEKLESNVAQECKSAFADLMTDLGDHGVSTADDNLPYLSFDQYAIRSIFPGTDNKDNSSLQPLGERLKHLGSMRLEHTRKTLVTFQRALVYNKRFLVTYIHALEPHFSMEDRVTFASVLMVALHDKIEYATDVLKSLLTDLIKTSVQKSHPELLLRRMETVGEKLLSNWIILCLHDYIRTTAGRPLYMLFQAVKAQTERGPIDAVTGEARYSLSEEKILREAITYQELTCSFQRDNGQTVSVRLQDCDTISQAKEKIMDAIYKTAPLSMRPDLSSVDLAMVVKDSPDLILRDEDASTIQEGNTKRINTLKSYGVSKDAQLMFVRRTAISGKSEKSSDFIGNMMAFSSQMSSQMPDDGIRQYHLVKQTEYDVSIDRQSHKMVHEIFLPRLIVTKNVLQRFVDDLFCKVFSVGIPSQPNPLVPEPVKYLFDFLDQQASDHGIDDPDIVHSWKNNSVALRFWINVIKNPDFVFDIHKTQTVDSSLSVVAQMFMDSCGTSDQRLCKDSPTTKLLYAREVQNYRRLVKKYYADILAMPAIFEGRMHDLLQQTSVGPGKGGFQKDSAMYDVFIYGLHYRDSVASALKEEGLTDLMKQFDDVCDELAHGFDEVSSCM